MKMTKRKKLGKRTLSWILLLGMLSIIGSSCGNSTTENGSETIISHTEMNDIPDVYYTYSLNLEPIVKSEGENVFVVDTVSVGSDIAILYADFHEGEKITVEYGIVFVNHQGEKIQTLKLDILLKDEDGYQIMEMISDQEGILRLILGAPQTTGDTSVIEKWAIYTVNTRNERENDYLLLTLDAVDTMSNERFQGMGINIDKDGNIYGLVHAAIAGEMRRGVVVIDSKGSELFRIWDETNSANGWNFGTKLFSYEGDVYVSGFPMKTEEPAFYARVDVNERRIKDKRDMNRSLATDSAVFHKGMNESIFEDKKGMYRFDMKTGEKVEMMQWDKQEIEISSLATVQSFLLSNGDIFVDVANETNGISSYYVLSTTKREMESNKNNGASESSAKTERKVIRVGVFNDIELDDPFFETAIKDFQKENRGYSVELIDFEDTIKGRKDRPFDLFIEMQKVILSGEFPDAIYINNAEFDFSSYARKGQFLDLYPFMDASDEYSRENYFESVLSALEMDEKLFFCPSAFIVSKLKVSRQSRIGNAQNLSMDFIRQIANDFPDKTDLLGIVYYKDGLLDSVDQFYDDFLLHSQASPDVPYQPFIDSLSFWLEFGSDQEGSYTHYYVEKEKFLNDESLVFEASFDYVSSFVSRWYLLDEPRSFVSISSDEKPGICVYPGRMLAISSGSTQPDKTWDLMKRMIDTTRQDIFVSEGRSEITGMPIRKSSFEKAIALAMDPPPLDVTDYYTNEHDSSFSWHGFDLDFFRRYLSFKEEELIPLPPEGADALRDLINRIDKKRMWDLERMEIENLIWEEAAAFYTDQKSADEVTKIIQNRISTYVNSK